MKREAIRGGAIGLVFTGASYATVSYMGFDWISLSVLMYLYVFLGVIASVAAGSGLLNASLTGILDRLVLVAEEEHLRLRKLASGEKYRVKGELEKL